MICSKEKKENRCLVRIKELCNHLGKNATIWIRGRVHATRAKGKQCFLILRQQDNTVQCILSIGEQISKQMVKFAGR